MLRVIFAGVFARTLEGPVRRHLSVPCDIAVTDVSCVGLALGNADILISTEFTEEMGREATRLRLLQVPGAGIDRIDRAALPENVMLANVFCHETGIAEYVLGAMLVLTREFIHLDKSLRRGDWHSQWAVGSPIPAVWPELSGKTVGILGYGHIGREVARRARAFDMAVCAIRRNPIARVQDDGVALLGGPDMMDEVLRRADYLVIAMPSTNHSRGAIGRRELALMKPTAYLINVARADLVDEAALYDALLRHAIAGAAIDVWYHYPAERGPTAPANWPFQSLTNVLMTPHISGWTDGMLEARGKFIAENIERVARGEAPLNRIA
jgi:phosphoglycerate dehydrogenase-like enzyme